MTLESEVKGLTTVLMHIHVYIVSDPTDVSTSSKQFRNSQGKVKYTDVFKETVDMTLYHTIMTFKNPV